jgi:hypothetical protein
MPKNVVSTDATELGSIPLPQQTKTYTVVSHPFIISETLEQLKLNGFEVDSEEYSRNLSGEIALGVYHLTHGNDPDLGLMFTWANSYDKSMRFRCAIGGFVHISGSRMIAGDMSNYGRIHTGDAKDQVQEHIKSQIESASSYFSALCNDKDKMKDIILNDEQVAELMGILYFQANALTSSQLITTKEEYRKPTFTYTTGADSLWTIYNHCILALKKSHPKTWMEQQKDLHKVIKARFLEATAPVTPTTEVEEEVVDPAQTNLLDQIEEIEAEGALEDKLDLAEEPTSFNLDHIPDPEVEEVVEEVPVIEEDPELLDSDAIEADSVLVQDPGALSLEAHSTGEEETIFPEAPEGTPEISDPSHTTEIEWGTDVETMKAAEESLAKEEAEATTPLEDQIAGEHVEPVTEAEEEVSAPPIVDEPISEERLGEELHGVNNNEEEITMTTEPTQHDLDMQSRLEAEIASENIDSVPEPEEVVDTDFKPEEDNNSNAETLESPFEY